VARPKKAKQRHEPESIAHTLDEIESSGDRLTQWVLDNPRIILGAGAAILLLAAGYGALHASSESGLEAASAALGAEQNAYKLAMGASPEDIVIPEPANPETARRVREEFAERFGKVATEYAGTAGGAVAGLEAGTLEQQLGRPEEALAAWQQAAESTDASSPMRALLELRIAAAHEAAGRWLEAGEAFERAAEVESFPLRQAARGDAARCYAEAGETERALAAYEQTKREAPDAFLPEHVEARMQELQAAQRLN
jgi:tetratricopeptide (TPR) repeat protein